MVKKWEWDPETAKEMQKKSAAKRKANNARRKTMRQELERLLASGDTQKKISVALVDRAISGDVARYTTIRDTVGEKPIDRRQVRVDLPTINIVRADNKKNTKNRQK